LKQREDFQNLEKMPFEIIFLYYWLFAKEFEKAFTNNLQKNNLSGANVVQNIKLEESNHILLEILLSWLKFKVTYEHLSKLQTSYILSL
jgi:hypothetical protein